MKYLMTFFGLCCLPFLAQAGPQINVGVVYDYLDGEKSTYLKRVFNGGDATAFVKVNVLEIVYDAEGVPQEIPVKSQADVVARDGLMASPARLIVPANGMQGTRLLFMGEREHERYFRVRFIPVVPEQEDQFAVSSEEREDYKKELSAGVNILAGYGTIFFVRPKVTRFDTKIENTKGQYLLRNNGNSVVIVDQFKDCSSKSEQECNPVTKHHILAGREFKFDKQAGREYRFKLVEGEKKKTIEVKG
ncbi:molecular chaperone [Pseudomonas sp. Y24-6]|uniref:molecular chaperone n=1 Tax=Pseudomonas sp. Y24-6 TaxID=2750013 RepID=UPI001CE02E89|nr:molecular chaperone [Pseudomonas sp. Y24-6]